MKVYQRLAADFVAEGVTYIFGIMSDGNMYWMHELDKLGGVKMLEVRHEGAGLGMADSWARVTRTPGVATTTCGPGVTQLATALLTASRAASPLVAFCGEFPSNDDEYLQRMDQAAFAAGCETGFIRDRKSTRLNSSHSQISYAVFCLKKKQIPKRPSPRSLREINGRRCHHFRPQGLHNRRYTPTRARNTPGLRSHSRRGAHSVRRAER